MSGLPITLTKTVVAATKPLFVRHSILDVVISDNGPQFSSREYTQVAKDYEFRHVTSSPYHPQETEKPNMQLKQSRNYSKIQVTIT